MDKKSLLRKIILVPLILSMMCVYMPQFTYVAYAAGVIGSLNGTTYDDFDDLIDDLEDDYSGKTVTIEMLANWDADEDGDFNERLIIPSNCKATLNMNGHVFDRGETADNDSSFNGELITMESGSNLTINGGDTSVSHSERVYTSTDRDAKASTWKDFHGGVLTGGASDNGAGGIHVKSNCTLTMNDVTLAGCRAHAPWYDKAGTNSAYGGGIWLAGGDTNLTLNNSTITGCFAYYDGGGIFQSNHNNVRIELNDSHVDANFAGDEGGGIDVDGEKITIKGKGKSTVNGNQSKNDGGGIYMWNDEVTINNLTIANNKAGGNGGGIYSQEETISMGNLVITDNHADGRGGGIYINNDGNTISSCTITNNSAGVSGNGVYVYEDVDEGFTVSGTTVIKDNGGSNLYMSDGDWEDSRIQFSLTKGAEVWIRYYDGNHDTIMVTPGKQGDEVKAKDYSQYLYSDQDGYYFAFDSAADMRKIMRYKGEREKKPKPVGVKSSDANDASAKGETSANTTKAGVVRQVGEGGDEGTGYDLIRGFYMHEKFDSGTDDNLGVFYYTDGFFYGDGAEYTYNPHMGTASWVLAYACSYLRHDEEADENGNVYYNKHAGGKQFLADIGCPDQKIYVNDSMQVEPGLDSIGVTIASKELEKNGKATGDILIPVGIRGGGYGAEWASNVTLGTYDDTEDIGHEARGFATAADITISEIEYYLKKYDLEDEYKNGNVIFWVSGFSRAGATANLTSKRLVDKIAEDCTGDKKSRVFGYPCEAPKGGTDEAEVAGNDYTCIHNMVNKVDVVPYVGPEQMGFKRYGVDHYIPGTDAGTIKEEKYEAARFRASPAGHDKVNWFKYVTTRRDNTYTPTKTADYEARRALMLSHLAAIDSDMLFDDYFHPMAMDFIPPHMYEEGDYDENRAEDFVQDFIRFVQEGFPQQKWYLNRPGQGVDSRQRWAEELQNPMRDTMSLVFSISEENKEGFVERAASIMDKIKYIGGSDISMKQVYDDVIGDWHTLSDKDKKKYTDFFWKKLDESGALDYLSETDRANLEKDWPAIANFIFRMIDGDYNLNTGDYAENPSGLYSTTYGWAKGVDETMTYLPTFATFSSYILSSHNPEINMAWAMTYDSYYQNGPTNLEPTEYELVQPSKVDPPKAYVKAEVPAGGGEGDGSTTPGEGDSSATSDEEEQLDELDEGESKNNDLRGDQKIILENNAIVGEAVYYDLYDVTDGSEKLDKNELYQGGIDLTLGDEVRKSYKIVTYDMSYGVKSTKATYNINLYSSKHNIEIVDKAKDGTKRTATSVSEEGAEATVMAGKSDSDYFTSWTVSLLDGKGNVIAGKEDITDEILGDSKAKNETAVFTLPVVDKNNYPEGYGLRFTANYKDKINSVEADPTQPVAGEDLPKTIKVTFDNGETAEYPVTWTYTYKDEDGNEQTVITSGEAYQDTVYTATIRFDQDEDKGVIFANPTGVSSTVGTVTAKDGKVSPDANDGSILFSIKFDPTGEDGGQARPEETFKLTLNMIDLNAEEDEKPIDTVEYQVLQGQSITLTAPQVDNEKFAYWTSDDFTISSDDSKKSAITINIPGEVAEGKTFSINACYKPLVSAVTVSIDPPKGGVDLVSAPESLKITVGNSYTISPDCYELRWSPATPESGKAAYMTEYTAIISMKPKTDAEGNKYIEATDDEGKAVKFGTDFEYADELKINASAKDEADDDLITGSSADTANNTVYIKFKPTVYNLAEVKPLDPISGLSHDQANTEGVQNALPSTVKILTDNGMELDAEVEWKSIQKTDGGGLEASTWEAKGTVKLPPGVDNRNNVSLEVSTTVSVNAADAVSSPTASVESGTYLADQYVTLQTDTEGATIYYTLNGDDPSDPDSERFTYDGSEIEIRRENAKDGKIMLQAYAVKDDMYDSMVAAYEYSFTNEVERPEDPGLLYNMEEQVGINGSDFYELEAVSDGVKIDENGNAVATEAGTYTVKAKIKDGFMWVYDQYTPTKDTKAKADKDYYKKNEAGKYEKVTLEEGEDIAEYIKTETALYEKEQIKTETDQTITFTIEPLSLKEAVVEVLEDPARIKDGKAEPKVKVTVRGIELPEGSFTVKYSNNTKKGTGKLVVVGDGKNIVDESAPVSFKVLAELYTITYDLNGGNYKGKTGTITRQYEDGKKIKLLGAPSKPGYEFAYWKGSKYKAKAKYKVTGDHTFVAQWKAAGSKGANTGDDNLLAVYITILLAAVAGLVSAVMIRRKRAKERG